MGNESGLLIRYSNPIKRAQIFNQYFSNVYGPKTVDKFDENFELGHTPIKINDKELSIAINSN